MAVCNDIDPSSLCELRDASSWVPRALPAAAVAERHFYDLEQGFSMVRASILCPPCKSSRLESGAARVESRRDDQRIVETVTVAHLDVERAIVECRTRRDPPQLA